MTLLTCQLQNGTVYEVTIRAVGEVLPTDYHYIQLMNILLRQAMGNMKLAQVGRNFFDPQAKIVINEYKLELWPGYVTSIRQHENDLMMCVELSTKILRKDSAYDQMKSLMSKGADGRQAVTRLLLGVNVITKYNNRTYRIDDISWTECPSMVFDVSSSF